MDVITMPSIDSLIAKLQIDYPQLTFKESDCFSWSPNKKTIYLGNSVDENIPYLLHELAHAILGHASYSSDVELINMECEAWNKVVELAKIYDVSINQDSIQSDLDTYRDWLHKRSLCPKCQANGLQNGNKIYQCLVCNNKWRVNEARFCALRRYKLAKK